VAGAVESGETNVPMKPHVAQTLREFGQLLQPPVTIKLSEWSEQNIVLPEGQSVRPGRLHHWPYMREILDAIGDRDIERVTVQKSARCGYTKGLMFAIGAAAATNPSPIILLVPTDPDARRFAVEEVEPIFESSPALKGLLRRGRSDGRNTLLRKALLGGGSIKILSARAPRKLRAHDCKYLFIDESDGMEVTAEGDPISIAIGRTFAHGDRKIVVGSTPTEEGISFVERQYEESDQRVFEVSCPSCGAFFEIIWEEHIKWPQDETGYRFDEAYAECPHCQNHIQERDKPAMVHAGRWRATKPEVLNHAGFRVNSLISLLPNAAWSKLAAEFVKAKRGGPAELQPFVNLVLGRPWRLAIRRVDADTLSDRAEPIGLTRIPAEVLLLTVGADVQDASIQVVVVGWSLHGAPSVLAYLVFQGNTLESEVWSAFDSWLKSKWKHSNGWTLGIDACAIDSGGREGRTQKIYDWCAARAARNIFAIKGQPNARPVWKRAEKVLGIKQTQVPLFNVAVDVVKTMVMDALANEPFDEHGERRQNALRFSDELSESYFEQITNEVRKVRYEHNRAKIVFEVKRAGLPVDALDATGYAFAVKHAAVIRAINLQERSERRASDQPKPKRKSMADYASALNG
jgi:phage terminase large subunit GpA-like protein